MMCFEQAWPSGRACSLLNNKNWSERHTIRFSYIAFTKVWWYASVPQYIIASDLFVLAVPLFMKTVRFWALSSDLILLAGALTLCLSQPLLALLGGILIAAGIAISLVKVRCPFCHHYIGLGYGHFCKHCGGPLKPSKHC